MVHQRPDEMTDSDFLTWEVQLRREGTLPPEVQERLLSALRAFSETQVAEIDEVLRENDRLVDRVRELENEVSDLNEQL